MATTNLAQLVNPEVMKQMVEEALPNKIKFMGLANVDNTLVGIPGNTITIPKWAYVGDAEDIAEGIAMDTAQLATTDSQVTIKKAGKAVELTDEAVLSGLGDPIGTAARQVTKAIASKVDNDIVTALLTTSTVYNEVAATFGKELIVQGIALFGEDMEDAEVLIINNTQYAELMVHADFVDKTKYGADVLYTGEIGMIYGARVLVSAKVPAKTFLIMKSGAVSLYMKRNLLLESDRDILAGKTVIAANEHFVAGINDESKVVKVTYPAS